MYEIKKDNFSIFVINLPLQDSIGHPTLNPICLPKKGKKIVNHIYTNNFK